MRSRSLLLCGDARTLRGGDIAANPKYSEIVPSSELISTPTRYFFPTICEAITRHISPTTIDHRGNKALAISRFYAAYGVEA